MPSYERAPKAIREQVTSVVERYHSGLADAGIRIDVLMVRPTVDDNDDPTGPAIKVGGYPAVACIRILGLKDRVARGYDAEMLLDADHYELAGEADQVAMIDHEITHIEAVTDEKGAIRLDDAERPKLKMRKHDVNVGWFSEIARRHGEASLEIQQARAMLESDNWTQCFLPGMEPVEA
jgi:hypothetical protein